MSFLSQIFPERSAHRDRLYLFSDFCVHFREGDIGDVEQNKIFDLKNDRLELIDLRGIELFENVEIGLG